MAPFKFTLGCLSETKQICLLILRAHFTTLQFEGAKGTALSLTHISTAVTGDNMSGSDDVP